MNLQDVYELARVRLEKFSFLGYVKGRAGRLQLPPNDILPHYKAVFTFKPENKTKARRLIGDLSGKFYGGATFEFEDEYKPNDKPTGLNVVIIRAKDGKPAEQEETLIKALRLLDGYLESVLTNSK